MRKQIVFDPNNGPFPSSPGNNPYALPFLAAGVGDNLSPAPGMMDVSTVTEMAGIAQINEPEMVPQGPNNDLAMLRSRFPFVPILPMQGQLAAIFLPTALLADELVFPDGTTMVLFKGNNDYYISMHGKAEVPTVITNPAGVTGGAQTSRSFFKPEGFLFYVGNIKSLSIVAPNNNTIITALCYCTNQWPVRDWS